MKSCESNGGAAYSPPVPDLAGTARRVALGNRRGGLMGRWVSLHRFVLVLCACLCLAVVARGSMDPAPSAHPETRAAKASSQQASSSRTFPFFNPSPGLGGEVSRHR